jgi:hypothetical protein
MREVEIMIDQVQPEIGDADVVSILDKAEQWSTTLTTIVNEIHIDNTPHIRMSAPPCYLSIRHFSGIVLLSQHNMHGSASALLRLQFESYVRSAWLYYSATNTELTHILKEDMVFPRINKMLHALQKIDDNEFTTIKEVNKDIWNIMNDLTHGGIKQIIMHSSEGIVEQNISPSFICGLITNAALQSLLAALLMISMAHDVTAGNSLWQAFKYIFPSLSANLTTLHP